MDATDKYSEVTEAAIDRVIAEYPGATDVEIMCASQNADSDPDDGSSWLDRFGAGLEGLIANRD